MLREELVAAMTAKLQEALYEESPDNTTRVVEDSPLVGPQAVVSSLGLVSYIVDVESMVAETCGAELILVNESALSRTNSPFRTVGTLADYVIELLEETVGDQIAVTA